MMMMMMIVFVGVVVTETCMLFIRSTDGRVASQPSYQACM